MMMMMMMMIDGLLTGRSSQWREPQGVASSDLKIYPQQITRR